MSTWWRHQMETFSSLLAICAGNSPVKDQWRGALTFSLIYAWINGWVNHGETGDLRRHLAHYDVTVMCLCLSMSVSVTISVCASLHPCQCLYHSEWLKCMYFAEYPCFCATEEDGTYRQTSNISRTKSPNLNVSRLVLQLSLPKPLKPAVKSRMKMQLECSADRRCSNYIYVIHNLIAY